MRGWDILPERIGGRIALFALLIWGTLIYWHWEAMLITYLSTRQIVLPFNNIPELVSASPFRIFLIPGSSYEDAFKTSRDPSWMAAWEDRVKPYLAENGGISSGDFVDMLTADPVTAYYDNYFSVM